MLFYEKLYAKEIENQFWEATENIDTHMYLALRTIYSVEYSGIRATQTLDMAGRLNRFPGSNVFTNLFCSNLVCVLKQKIICFLLENIQLRPGVH